MKYITVYTISIVALILIYMASRERLQLYDKWYQCMYQDWNETRCINQVYGTQSVTSVIKPVR